MGGLGITPSIPIHTWSYPSFPPQHLKRRSPAFRERGVMAHFQPLLSLQRTGAAIQMALLALLWEERCAEAEAGLVQCSCAQNYLQSGTGVGLPLRGDLVSMSIPQFWYCFHEKLWYCHGSIAHTYWDKVWAVRGDAMCLQRLLHNDCFWQHIILIFHSIDLSSKIKSKHQREVHDLLKLLVNNSTWLWWQKLNLTSCQKISPCH